MINFIKGVVIALLLFSTSALADIPKEIIEAANANTYRVMTTTGSGSAYFVGDNKLVTACHVTAEDTDIILVDYTFEYVLTAKVLSCNEANDLAVLELKPDSNTEKLFQHEPPPFASRDPEIGQSVYGGGYPMGIGLIYVEGHWQDLFGGQGGTQIIVTTPAMFGDSGSAAFVIEDDEVKYIVPAMEYSHTQ